METSIQSKICTEYDIVQDTMSNELVNFHAELENVIRQTLDLTYKQCKLSTDEKLDIVEKCDDTMVVLGELQDMLKYYKNIISRIRSVPSEELSEDDIDKRSVQ